MFGHDNVNIMENWKDGNITFLYKPHKRFTAIFQGSLYKRFGKDDEQISTEIYVGLSQNLYFQSLLGFGTKNNFLPKQRFNGELSYNAGNGSVFNIGINLLNFPEELISIYTSGYTFYFPKYFFLDYKYYYSSGKEDIFNSTHLMRLNYLIEKKIRISAGYAYGGEAFHITSTQEISNLKSHSYISYLTFWFNPSFGIRTLLSYTKDIWLDEENTYNNLDDLAQQFDKDIEEVIDCVHGNKVIEQRPGKAYGEYTVDVSKWIIGYISGREISPDEVLTTNELNPDNLSYDGVAVQLQNGTPAEVWAAERLDKTITYERNTYDVERPVSLSSWPTLDPLTHHTEDSTRSQEDAASIDLENLDTGNAPAGYFVSFHAYPYYPDFISEEPDYITFSDNAGLNSYLGYLTYLKEHYSKHPLIVAEYGVPSSWGNAHFAHSGMDQGGLDEKQQGEYNVRMLENIYNSGCGGGILFSWIDEWFKQCWINNPIGPEASRRPLWHNVTNPEQNYGLIAFDSGTPDYSKWETVENSGRISQIRAAVDNKYFYVKINLDSSLALGESLVIGYDTYRNDLGESILPDNAVTSNRAEFALSIAAPDTAHLYVTQAYDLFGIWHNVSEQNQVYHSIPTDGKPWVPVRWKNNYYEDAIFDAGQLRIRNDTDESTSLDAVTLSTNEVEIRIPWTYLNFTDPSLLQVMDDNRETEVPPLISLTRNNIYSIKNVY